MYLDISEFQYILFGSKVGEFSKQCLEDTWSLPRNTWPTKPAVKCLDLEMWGCFSLAVPRIMEATLLCLGTRGAA